ncbi:MAG: molybdopterin-dependent oxidoreductase [Acidimicrobiia bacterium]
MDPRSAAVGVVGAGLGLGVAELAAGVLPDGRSPLVAVAELVIRNVPGGVERWAIETFGRNDKAVLVVGAVVVVLLLGALTGALARRPLAALTVAGLTVAVGCLASLRRLDSTVLDLVPPLVGGGAAIVTMLGLLRLGAGRPAGPLSPDAMGRRTLLVAGSAVAVAAPFAGWAGQRLQRRVDAAASRAKASLPAAARPAPPLPAGADLRLDGLSPFITPNADFYRIDTALLVPQVTAEDWTLRIHGMVDREVTFTYDELLARPLVEADVTLACVSNEVGGSLVGNARWLGVPLRELLEEAGVHDDADQVVGRSVDDFTVGFPTAAVFDGRDALVAVGMNGEPLPVRHGFPARLVVAGLYGYVSATKWLKEIELTRFDRYDAYWIRLDWAPPAPIKVQSRIDTPGNRAGAGRVAVAGVAWAQGRGIDAVEVRIDGGPWRRAELADEVGPATWRQWHLPWTATEGRHVLEVRATAGDGEVQTGELAEPFPSGATGWHRRVVRVV